MESVPYLIVGAGITGLAAAAFAKNQDLLVLERDAEIGGYCKTVKQDGFVWDYSGHFFHFKHADVEAWLRERMPGQHIRTVKKASYIAYKGRLVDFPFQKNIHQLPRAEFIDCLHDLFFARAPGMPAAPETNFLEMLYARFGRSIAEKFLVPYNEKLYACDLARLDRNAMGRFFPHADVADVIRNMKTPDNGSYNAAFTYPEGGAIEYVNAIATEVPKDRISLGEALVSIDLARKVAVTSRREIAYRHLISSAPFDKLVAMAGLDHDASVFSYNRVLVHNLGFDKKGWKNVHWVYFPDRARSFYRVGFYDNIFDASRMSLYVEMGFPREGDIDVDATRGRVIADLAAEGILDDHRLVASHAVVMDPAYVHITERSIAEHARLSALLRAHGVFPVGRYGGWTYCSIEDDILEARALMSQLV